MKSNITNRQMFFVLFLSITTYTSISLPQLMAQAAGRNSWISIIAGSVIFGIAAVIIAKLNAKHQDKIFFDYSQQIVGKFITYIFAFYYILYFLYISNHFIEQLVVLLTSNFLPNTPHKIITFFGIALFSYVAYKGMTNVARMTEIIGVIYIMIMAGICIAMMVTGTKYNILPLFNLGDLNFDALKKLIVPFCGAEILLVIPFTTINKKAGKAAFLTLLAVGFFYLIIVESTIMTFGINNTMVTNDSIIEAMRVVEVPMIERMDIYYLAASVAATFMGLIIMFAGFSEFACKIFSKTKRQKIFIILGILSYALCFIYDEIKNSEKIFNAVAPYLIIISVMVIPIIVHLVANMKKKSKKDPIIEDPRLND